MNDVPDDATVGGSTGTPGSSDDSTDPPGSETQDPDTSSGDSDPESDASTGGMDASDSGDETDGGDSSGTGGPDTGADVTPPEVVSVTPMDGALGIVEDAVIVIAFSEPMDRVATQAAWQSPDIGGVTMSWNGDDTELTITPNAPLEYATGPDVATLEANAYSFTLDTTATDKAGNALPSANAVTFSTLRRIEYAMVPVSELTGRVRSNGVVDAFLWVSAGDTAVTGGEANDQQKGFISFDLSALPDDIAAVEVANLHADQTSVNGTPYTDLGGQVRLLRIAYDELGLPAFYAAVDEDVGVFSDDATLEVKELDVVEQLQSAHDAAEELLQFRLEFPVATDNDADLDTAGFYRSTVRMDLRYLAE